MSQHQKHIEQAIALAKTNVENGGGPFGAIVITAAGKVYEGVNRVTDNNDPTAHAEVTAIRNACQGEGTFDLTGATIYSSCEPCPMCLGACLWARIEDIRFAADRFDAADAGFDDAAFYEILANPPVKVVDTEVKNAPFDAWKANADKIEY